MATIKYSTGFRDALLEAGGESYADILADGVIHLYAGSMPTNADAAAGSTELVVITDASGAFTFGSATNGINFGVATSGVLAQAAGEVWSGVGLSVGTIGWGRFSANDAGSGTTPTGASTTAKRLDFDVNTSGAALNLGSTTTSIGGTVTIESPTLTAPATVTA